MKIKIHLVNQSHPLEIFNIKNCYTKDVLYCVYKEDGTVEKYPLCNIFRIIENYN